MPKCPLDDNAEVVFHARAQDIEYFTMPGRSFEFHRCPRCDVLFVSPMLADRLGDIYPANYYSFTATSGSVVQRIKEWLDARYMRRVLGAIAGERLSALDVGGGNGWLLDQLKRADPRVADTLVVDIDAGARSAAERAGHRFFEGRFEEFADDRPRDVILMLNLVEHVPDPRAVLVKARELLAPGGRILVKTPNFDALDAKLFRHRSWAGYHTPRHFVLFRKESFERLAREAGLEVLSFSYTQGAPFWSVSALDVLRRAGFVHVDAERPAANHPLTPLLQAVFAAFDMLRARLGARLSQMQFVLGRRQ